MKNKQINEFIDLNNNIIQGDMPQYDTGTIKSTKTSDEMDRLASGPNNYNRWFGMGYLYEDEKVDDETKIVVEQVFPVKEYDNHEVIDNTITELPNIYSITNPLLVNKLKSLISILNADKNEVDKVAVFADFINNVDFSDISTIYKKLLVNKLKEKF